MSAPPTIEERWAAPGGVVTAVVAGDSIVHAAPMPGPPKGHVPTEADYERMCAEVEKAADLQRVLADLFLALGWTVTVAVYDGDSLTLVYEMDAREILAEFDQTGVAPDIDRFQVPGGEFT